MEQWKDIKWFEWLYQVSNLGNVRSFHNNRFWIKDKSTILKPIIKKYCNIWLYNKNKIKYCLIHRLVAQAFIPNPKNKAQVNHKDWNKHNNCLYNLEWVTASENIIHSYKILKRIPSKASLWKFWKDNYLSKKVNQYDLDWNFIKTWDCMQEIQRELWISQWWISSCCNMKYNRKTAWWFIWKFFKSNL